VYSEKHTPETPPFVRTPESICDDAQFGKMPYGMFTVLFWLHRRANWTTGIVKYSSPEIISRCTQGTLPVKAAQRAMHRAELQGYITCGIVRGSTDNYPVMIHNYTATFQDKTGEEIVTHTRVINKRELRTWKQVRAAGSKENRRIIMSMRKSMNESMSKSMNLSMSKDGSTQASPAGYKKIENPVVHEPVHENDHELVHEDVHLTSLIETKLTETSLKNESETTKQAARAAAAASGVATPPATSNYKSNQGTGDGRPVGFKNETPVEPMAPPFSEDAEYLSQWFWSNYGKPNSKSSCVEFEKLLQTYPNLSEIAHWAFKDRAWGNKLRSDKVRDPLRYFMSALAREEFWGIRPQYSKSQRGKTAKPLSPPASEWGRGIPRNNPTKPPAGKEPKEPEFYNPALFHLALVRKGLA